MFARVIHVSSLPVPYRMADVTCLTAVRMQTLDGETAVLFENSPLAATLTAGEWVEYQLVFKDRADKLRVLPASKLPLSLATSPNEVPNMLHLMAHMTDTGADEWRESLGMVNTVYERLMSIRDCFNVKRTDVPLPDALVIESLPEEIKTVAQLYVDIVAA